MLLFDEVSLDLILLKAIYCSDRSTLNILSLFRLKYLRLKDYFFLPSMLIFETGFAVNKRVCIDQSSTSDG